MENGKSHYEEKLSAYLDGELSPAEMAEIATELESNPKLAEMLERMRRLDAMTDTALPDFDNALMERLEQNIMSGLDSEEVAPAETESIDIPPKKIIPIWQRYLSIAASIAVFFLVGKMAFEETKDKDLMPVQSKPIIMTEDRAWQNSSVLSDELEEADAIDSDKNVGELSIKDEPVKRERIESEVEQPAVAPDELKEMAHDVTMTQMLVPPPAAEVSAPQTIIEKPTTFGMSADEKIVSNIAVPEEIVITDESTQAERLEQKGETKQEEILVDKESGDFDDYRTPLMSNTIEQLEPAKIVADSYKGKDSEKKDTEFSGDGFARVVSNELDSILLELLPLDSLKDIYTMYVTPTKELRKTYYGRKSASFESSGPEISRMAVLLDSLSQLPGIDNDADEIESLYLQAKTHYEMYRETQDVQHYTEAVNARRALDNILADKLRLQPENSRLHEYAKDISTWQFDR